MAGEIPQPEREAEPEAGLFNLARFSDGQVTELLLALHLRAGETEPVDELQQTTSDVMINVLHADLRDMAQSDPSRLRSLLDGYAHVNGYDFQESHKQEAAAAAAGSLIDYDYAFARDTLTR